MIEERDIPGWPGRLATSDGRILSTLTGQLVECKQRLNAHGYFVITLHKRTHKGKCAFKEPVHRLIAKAFHGEPMVGQQCRHLNGVRTDNRPGNLAWGTAAENAADAKRHGTLGEGMLARRRKLTDAQVRDIRSMVAGGVPCSRIAKQYGIHDTYPRQLAQRATWRDLKG